MPEEQLVDRVFLEKLERLTIQWHQSFPGLVGGRKSTRYAGPGQEFLDHRHFHLGDDLRAVNWRAYLRLEKLFLKMFRVEPHIPLRLLLDTSRSMITGSAPKFDYAKRLAAALSYVGLVRLDTTIIQPFSDVLADHFACGGGRHRFAPAVRFLEGLQAEGRTSYFQAARQFVGKFPQRGLLIVISDFLDDGDCGKALQYLADFGHELLILHVWAEEDRTPPWEGQLDLTDAETGARLELEFDARARENYTARFDAYAREISQVALRNDGRYVGLSASMPVEDAIFGPLARAGGVG